MFELIDHHPRMHLSPIQYRNIQRFFCDNNLAMRREERSAIMKTFFHEEDIIEIRRIIMEEIGRQINGKWDALKCQRQKEMQKERGEELNQN